MFTAKDGKKFGSSMVGKNYDEKHSEDGTHMLGEEPKESGMKKMGEGDKKVAPKAPTSNKPMSRTDSEGEAKNLLEDTSVEQGEPKGMNQEENSQPEEQTDPQDPRTDENGEATNEDVVPDDVKSDAAAHGPASKIVVTHDKSTGRHSVASVHADGHMHQSIHKTAQAAHASAKHLGMPKQEPEAPGESDHLLG
jgi:hypothetical protein